MKYSLGFTSLCFISLAAALHLPFTRRVPSRLGALSRRSTNVLAQSSSLALINQDNKVYSSTLNVAGKDVPVNLDTGSTDLWLYNYTEGLLDRARIYSNIFITDTYGKGFVNGSLAQIDVTFAGYTVQNQSFLYATGHGDEGIIDERAGVGLLGLGFDTFSNVYDAVEENYPGATWGRSLLSNIFLSNPSAPNHIAFRLDRLYDSNTTDTGSFDIGTFAPGMEAVNNTAPIPIFNYNSTINKYRSVVLDDIAINGQNQTLKTTISVGDVTPPDGKLAAVLDTGFSLPQLTTELAHTIYTSIGGVLWSGDPTNATYVVPCMTEGNLTFFIGGQSISIHPLDITFVTPYIVGGQNVTVCVNAFQPFTSDAGGGQIDVILGDAFLRNTCTVYDFGDPNNGTSGFPRQNPYIKLLPLTDPIQTSAEFKTARKAYLDTLPPQLNVSTANSQNPQVIPGTSGPSGSNAATRTGVNIAVMSILGAVVGVFCLL
ncbi:acid protease [Ceratobasidium sp. AG-I]|nr:acid protease [Ceratobasidium sp. AG-I]